MNQHQPMAGIRPAAKRMRRGRGWWLKQIHNWHWISAAVSMIGMFLFAATGITLNHAATIGAKPSVVSRQGLLPPPLVHALHGPRETAAPLPAAIAAEIARQVGIDPSGRPAEWSDSEAYVALPRPGGDAWVSVDRAGGGISAEITDRGWISYLNDLHKGRNAGAAWAWFIDIFAAACILFTLTGFFLLQFHARHRRLTWLLVAVGFALPMLIVVLFVH